VRIWYALLDLAAVVGTLIADADGVYDPRAYNDRLLLGLRGMLSEAELHWLQLRLSCWMSTAIGLSRCGNPRWRRYARTRGPEADAQHRATASATASTPLTLSSVSYWPANEAAAVSSSAAEDRTATLSSTPQRSLSIR
jgi:hypothetical protein